jgi:hypothetical protein
LRGPWGSWEALGVVLGVVLLGDGALLGALGGAVGILEVSWKALGVVLAGLGGRHAHEAEKIQSVRNPPPASQRFTGAPATSETFVQHLLGFQKIR